VRDDAPKCVEVSGKRLTTLRGQAVPRHRPGIAEFLACGEVASFLELPQLRTEIAVSLGEELLQSAERQLVGT
jgi:hypothetical protein